MTNEMPRDKGLDNTNEVLLHDGYKYILNKRRELATKVFETRLLGEKTICLGGAEAAELFYDNGKFKRGGAMPDRVLNTLFGQGGVQTLDGEEHHRRKQLFMPLLFDKALSELRALAEINWNAAAARWENEPQIVLYDEVQEILTRTMAEWVGVPVAEDDWRPLAEDLTKMFEAAAKVGGDHRDGKKAREERERWMMTIVQQVRNGDIEVPEHTMLYQFAAHKDIQGEVMSDKTAAVEVLNLLRPMVAVAVYINFTALALHDFPEQVEKARAGGGEYGELFAQEVRRFYPFFPFAGARVQHDFTWEGYEFKEGTLTLLDLYGTNHDEHLWEKPEQFNPERFLTHQITPFDLIPQGGGEHLTGHRCPGEWATIEMIKVALDYLVNRLEYNLPEQDFSYSMTEMPSMPKDQMILADVRRK